MQLFAERRDDDNKPVAVNVTDESEVQTKKDCC
jgi:hypothetical protein